MDALTQLWESLHNIHAISNHYSVHFKSINIKILFINYISIKLEKYIWEPKYSCPTLCDPMDCSLPGSSDHGIFQARVLEWGAISFSRGSSRPRDRTRVSRIVGRGIYCLSHQGRALMGVSHFHILWYSLLYMCTILSFAY